MEPNIYCLTVGTNPGHVMREHISWKGYFFSSSQYLDKAFVKKNNHHLDCSQGSVNIDVVSMSIVIFSFKPWQIMLKIHFLIAMETDKF